GRKGDFVDSLVQPVEADESQPPVVAEQARSAIRPPFIDFSRIRSRSGRLAVTAGQEQKQSNPAFHHAIITIAGGCDFQQIRVQRAWARLPPSPLRRRSMIR